MNSTEACIALNMLPTVGPVRLRKLLEIFAEPQRVLAAKRSELRAAEGIGNEVADQIANWESIVDVAAELDRIREFGATVISGLARGIDTAAHQGALAAKGRTIAVIGSGLSKLYPPENRGLAEKIRDGNGAIVSEFSMEIEPDRQTFPMRNRIIAGWSHGVLVVEAGLSSGALITASQALEQGRSVYAVPGHINAPSAFGSNRLIQQGAKLVMDASDILDDLQILLPETKPSPEAAARTLPALSDEERRVYDAIESTETAIDDIGRKCQLPSATVSSVLLRLELKRLVKQLPGKYFVKLG